MMSLCQAAMAKSPWGTFLARVKILIIQFRCFVSFYAKKAEQKDFWRQLSPLPSSGRCGRRWVGTAVSVPSWAIPIVRGGLAGAIFDCRMGTPTWATFFWGESSSVSSPGRRKSSFVPRLAWGQGLSLQPSPGEFGLSANKLLFVVRFCRIFRAASVFLCDSFVWLALQKSILLCDCICFNDCFPRVVIMKTLHVFLHVLSPESALFFWHV